MSEITILAVLNRIAASTSIDEAWEKATAHFATLGFRRANYGFTRFRHLKTIGDPDDALFLTTCDAEYVKRYFQGGFYAKTPVFRWAERSTGICTWTWVKEAFEAGRLSTEEAEAVRQN
ncbi:MAG: autoinducer binding domain-containing protein, partial [Paracoccaceae bacterium]|nr:autoinducer binding domain-containing protein [Paracoccaceae bacterium]